MNLEEYETKYFSIYRGFAETVRFILDKALLAADDLPRPQSIQFRAKGIESLRRRLVEGGNLDTQTLERDRRDLAGARIIFYTNNDVDRFLASPLIRENFEIDEDAIRIHHPTAENDEARYRAVHYTIKLREDRVRLPEYAMFAGLRCEIQVQTILNHAWSETSHDILYKNKLSDGYGGKAIKGLTRRFERIMDKYLKPAGFEIQKAQQEYERIIQGKELFDQNIPNLLDNAQNNNERYQILEGLKDYAIPNYDDLRGAYDGLKGPLLRAVKAARNTEPVMIETAFGKMQGFKADVVIRLIVEIVERLRYADVVSTLQILADIYRDESSDNIRQQITNAVKNMSEYDIGAYNQVGPGVQMALVDRLASMDVAEVDTIRPIALTVWTEAIQSDITGSKWTADSVVLSTGSVPLSDQLREVRDKAIKGLFAAYDRSADDAQRRAVLSALDAATRTPSQAQYSNELLVTTIKDATRILDFVMVRAKSASYELLQHLENRFLYDYFRARELSANTRNQPDCQAEARALAAVIIKFRDAINTDDRFVRYKVLVGFDSVYPKHWTDEEFEYKDVEEYRSTEAGRYIEDIDESNEEDWFNLIARCAETKSDDLATFPVFGNFINKLAEQKPEVAARFLAKASSDLRRFLAGFLNGLEKSSRNDIYVRALQSELESANNLTGIARHLRYSTVKNPDLAVRLLNRAIDRDDSVAVIECLLLALELYGTERIIDADKYVCDALTFLNNRKDPSWVWHSWFLEKNTKFYEELSPERTLQVLHSLSHIPQVNHRVERVLSHIAQRQPGMVWDYFGARLTRGATENEDEERYEAIPFRLHGLEKELSKNIQLAIDKGLTWFVRDRKLFQYQGGRLLSSAFPTCNPEFAAKLAELVKTGSDTEADFALAILQNYRGEKSTHDVLKEIVCRYPDDNLKLSAVRASIDSTGVVTGKFGFTEAWRTRKESLTEWTTDERPAIKAFAEKHIKELNLMITSEQRRVEADHEMRVRDFEDEDAELGDGGTTDAPED